MSPNPLTVVLALCVLAVTVVGCYRAPSDDDFCTIPTTNNSSITRHVDSFRPGVSY